MKEALFIGPDFAVQEFILHDATKEEMEQLIKLLTQELKKWS